MSKTILELQKEINELQAQQKHYNDFYNDEIKKRQEVIDAEIIKRRDKCVEGFYEDDEIIIYEKADEKTAIDAIKVLNDPVALKLLIEAKNDPSTKVNVTITKPFEKVLIKNGVKPITYQSITVVDKTETVIKGV